MARGTARQGKVLIVQNVANTGQATPFDFVGDWSVNSPEPPYDDVSALGDTRQQNVAGLVGATKIAFNGFTDLTSLAWETVADASPRKTYVYKDWINQPTNYWMGTVAYGGGSSGAVASSLKGSLTGTAIGAGSGWQGP